MAHAPEDFASTPQIAYLDSVLTDIEAGRLRLPKFGRPFVWSPQQMLSLFDSIEQGYPIGGFVIWETRERLESLDRVSGIEVAGPPSTGPVAYLLDGHQRLSTLFGTLMPQSRDSEPEPDLERSWRWDIYRALGDHEGQTDRFRHWTRDEQPPPEYLPMRSVLRTMDFLAYSRRLDVAHAGNPEYVDLLLAEAEDVAHRFRSHALAITRISGGGPEQAAEVFSRLNSRGLPLTSDDLESARARSRRKESSDRIE